jgi:hypothetical protein
VSEPHEVYVIVHMSTSIDGSCSNPGKVRLGRSDIGGDPIVVLLTEQVSDAPESLRIGRGADWSAIERPGRRAFHPSRRQ